MSVLSAFAVADQPLAFNFNKVSVIQLLQATYGSILKKNYIIDPALASDSRVVTISVKELKMDQVKPTVDAVLKQAGIVSRDLAGQPYFYPVSASIQPGVNLPLPDSAPAAFPAQNNSVSPAIVAPGQPMAVAMVDYEDVRFYRPRFRQPDAVQKIANAMLGTGFEASDVVTLAGKKDKLDKLEKLLGQFDQAPPEVVAKALIFEFTDGKNEGASFGMALKAFSEKLSVSYGPAKALDNFIRVKNSTVDAVLSAVQGDTRFKLVSAPSVRVKDGSKGRITVGQEVPVLGNVQLDKNGNPTQSVEYRPSGVIFDIAPRVMRDRIELTLNQQISNFQPTSTSSINSPTLLKREVATTVGVESGEMIVLGGLDEEKENHATEGLSFLPRFLDTRKDEQTKSQVLLVLQVSNLDDKPKN